MKGISVSVNYKMLQAQSNMGSGWEFIDEEDEFSEGEEVFLEDLI